MFVLKQPAPDPGLAWPGSWCCWPAVWNVTAARLLVYMCVVAVIAADVVLIFVCMCVCKHSHINLHRVLVSRVPHKICARAFVCTIGSSVAQCARALIKTICGEFHIQTQTHTHTHEPRPIRIYHIVCIRLRACACLNSRSACC